MIRTVITCDVCERAIDKGDVSAFFVVVERDGIFVGRFADGQTWDDRPAHICGEACLHKLLSRLLPNL